MDKLCSAIIGNKYCKNYKGKNNIYCYKHNHLNLNSNKNYIIYTYILTLFVFFISSFAIIYNKPDVIVQMYNMLLNNNIYFESLYNNRIKKYLEYTLDTGMYYYNNFLELFYKIQK